MRLLPLYKERGMLMEHVTIIEGGKRLSVFATIRSIWQYRALLFALSKRDVSVKFKQAVIGIAWVVLQPLVNTAIFSVVFGIFAKFDSGVLPYPVFVFSGMVLWQFFSRATSEGSNSLVANSHLLTKVYFPRALLPLVPIFAASVDFFFASLFMLAISVALGASLAWTAFLIPFIAIAAGLMAYGIALTLAPINAIYRDIGIALPFLIQTLLFLTPIAYPQTLIPDRYQWLLDFHPLATLVSLIRWSSFGTTAPSFLATGVLIATIVILITLGIRVMRYLEGNLVDRI